MARLTRRGRRQAPLWAALGLQNRGRSCRQPAVSAPRPDPSELTGVPLRVSVRLFAGLREAAGWGERALAVRTGATPREVWRLLDLATRPDALPGELPNELRVAINQAFATPDTPLADGDELAFLPPISGG